MLLDYVVESIKSAGPLIIFGSFVFVCLNQIFPNKTEFNRIASENKWEQGRTNWERNFQKITKNLLYFLVILGVCFGLAYAWINQLWGLCTSLGLMSMVSLVLLLYIVRPHFRTVSICIMTKIVSKRHPLE